MAGFQKCRLCPNQCEPVFDRVVVSYLIRGGTRIMWELLDTFTDPNPLVFQLQVGQSANQNADDWVNVGGPIENAYYAIDPETRVFGKTNWTYYRVMVTSPRGSYMSAPVNAIGTLDRRDWRNAREIVRKEKLRFRFGAGQDGYLLKRRVTGVRCPHCLDYQTQEVTDPQCVYCYGTGFLCGYFYPMACIWADLSPKSRRIHIDGEARSTVNDIVVQARMLLTDLMGEDDVWVNKKTDDRYFIHKIDHMSEIRGCPLIGNVEMRPIAYSSVIYDIKIPDQLAHLGQLPDAGVDFPTEELTPDEGYSSYGPNFPEP